MALKQNNPGCDCCDTGGDTGCPYCTSGTSTPPTVTISGVGNNTCTCTAINATHTTQNVPANGTCWFRKTGIPLSCPSSGGAFIDATITILGSGNWGWRVYLNTTMGLSGNIVTYEWDSGGTTAFNCQTQRTLSYISTLNPEALCSNYATSTCQIN